LLIEHKHYSSEEEIITTELQRMKNCMVALLKNKEKRTQRECLVIVEQMDVYKKFLLNREDYLKTKRKSDMIYSKFFDEEGNLLQQESEVNRNHLNAVQKIILLDKLGMIEFLRNVPGLSTSINNLAWTLASITDEKQSTLQPYLNALLTKTAAENKHPYYSKSSVDKVKNMMVLKGIQPKTT
jgi:hypothetical protein